MCNFDSRKTLNPCKRNIQLPALKFNDTEGKRALSMSMVSNGLLQTVEKDKMGELITRADRQCDL